MTKIMRKRKHKLIEPMLCGVKEHPSNFVRGSECSLLSIALYVLFNTLHIFTEHKARLSTLTDLSLYQVSCVAARKDSLPGIAAGLLIG